MNKKIIVIATLLICFLFLISGCVIRDNKAVLPSKKPIETPTPTPEPTPFPEYPETIIQWMIPFGAGTDIDLWNRAIGDALAQQVGYRVMYTNISGGLSGSTGSYKVYNSRHDGYMFAGVGERNLTIPIYVEGELTSDDWIYFIAGGTPSVLCVSPNIGLESIQEFIMASENAEPDNELTVAVSGGGLQAALPYFFVTEGGFPFKIKEYKTDAEAIQACKNVEVDAVISPLNMVASAVDKRLLLPLAVMDDKDLTNHSFYKNSIPSIRTSVPSLKPEALDALKQFRGFALPADTPKHIILAIEEGFVQLENNQNFNTFLNNRYGQMYLYISEAAADHVKIAERYLCWVLSDMNRGGYTPDYVGIERPY
jgi:tripartite-type tricarboxylate transporter receptor subunit TctC